MPSPRASTGFSERAATVRRIARSRGGQGTVEYALVVFAFLGLLGGLGAMWHLLDAGMLVQHALQSASHHISAVAPGAFADVFMY